MRVVDTATGHFVEIDPSDRRTKYAILSHTWRRKGEQTYQQLRDIQTRYTPPDSDDDSSDDYSSSDDNSRPSAISKQPLRPIWAHAKLSSKVREACRIAREKGYRYLWIDSCCIDKTSSSELSESINSMYRWYALADVCYAFLADVPAEEDHHRNNSRFRRSRWFRRGWTLQELIAPIEVVFLAEDWTAIGSKLSLGDLIAEITNIDYSALLHVEPLDEFSVAQRFSWASGRKTTRVEDRAYSLLGIFDINMPTLYGEGERAFRRLQEEIMRRTPDQSLFAWTHFGLPDPLYDHHDPEIAHSARGRRQPWRRVRFHVDQQHGSLLAPSLDAFSKCGGIEMLSHDEVIQRLRLPANTLPTTDYDFTPYGIRMQLPVIAFSSSEYFPRESVVDHNMDIPLPQWYLVILGCGHKDFPGHLLGRVCYTRSLGSSVTYLYSGYIGIDVSESALFDLLPVSPATITRLHSSHISSKTLHIPQPQRNEVSNDPILQKPHKMIKLMLQKKTRDALSAQGYSATLRGPDVVYPTTYRLTLVHDEQTIVIDYQHTLEGDGWAQKLTIEAHAQTLGRALRGAPGGVGLPGVPRRVDGHASGTMASWVDRLPWRDYPTFEDVQVNTPKRMVSTLRLGLTLATTNHYLLSAELLPANPVAPGPAGPELVRAPRLHP
ncbi:hypothetical protein V8D89_000323 [Ganoderma adspersum]